MVEVFGWSEGVLTRLGRSETLATASAGLPHGSYTSLRTHGGNRVVRLRDHVLRLSCSVAGHASLGEGTVRRALSAALRANAHPESRVRLTWSPPRLFLAVEPFVPLPEALYREGVACGTVPLQRECPQAKDTHFIETATRALAHLPEGAHEGLMVAADGTILEGLSSNVFAIMEGRLRTEGERALPGITRSLVIEVAAPIVPVDLRGVCLDECPRVAEAFLTSASRGVLPVVRIDGHPIGDRRPGPITTLIRAAYESLVEREAETV
jgi:branched-chain amino acid aminotransferase